MKKLKALHLVFENCDSAAIPREDILSFSIRDVVPSYHSCNIDECSTHLSTDHFWISFRDLKNLKYKTLFDFKGEDQASVYDRITRHADITHVNLEYEDGETIYIGVPWGSRHFYFNAFQQLRCARHKKDTPIYCLEMYKEWTLKKYWGLFKYRFRVWKFRLKHKKLSMS